MKNLSDMTDFELNLMMAKLVLDYEDIDVSPLSENQTAVAYADGCNWYQFDPCNCWKDIGKFIEERRISLQFLGNGWKSSAYKCGTEIKEFDVNPKRAAVIVYLRKENQT